MTNPTIELLPCPFCGAPAKTDNGFSPCESVDYVWCSNTECGCSPSGRGERMFTVEEWNRRELAAIKSQPEPVEPKEFPHVPAAYINAIAEEGDKREAIEFLQKTWNELCAIRQYTNDLQSALQVAQWNSSKFQSLADANQEIAKIISKRAEQAEAALKVAQQDCWNLTEKVIPNIRERQ